jgi:hypothetical protein
MNQSRIKSFPENSGLLLDFEIRFVHDARCEITNPLPPPSSDVIDVSFLFHGNKESQKDRMVDIDTQWLSSIVWGGSGSA